MYYNSEKNSLLYIIFTVLEDNLEPANISGRRLAYRKKGKDLRICGKVDAIMYRVVPAAGSCFLDRSGGFGTIPSLALGAQITPSPLFLILVFLSNSIPCVWALTLRG